MCCLNTFKHETYAKSISKYCSCLTEHSDIFTITKTSVLIPFI